MKKGIITLAILALMAPVSLMAQQGMQGGFDCPMDGRGAGMGQMGSGHRGMMQCDKPGRGGRGRGMGIQRLLMVAEEIGLSEDQQGQLEQMQVDFQMNQIDRKAELKKAQVTLRNLMRDDDASEADVNRAIDNVADLKADLQKAGYSQRKQVQDVLTEEQIAKLKELRAERMEKRSGKAGRGRGQGGGWGRP